jgi:hypothetical protein
MEQLVKANVDGAGGVGLHCEGVYLGRDYGGCFVKEFDLGMLELPDLVLVFAPALLSVGGGILNNQVQAIQSFPSIRSIQGQINYYSTHKFPRIILMYYQLVVPAELLQSNKFLTQRRLRIQ